MTSVNPRRMCAPTPPRRYTRHEPGRGPKRRRQVKGSTQNGPRNATRPQAMDAGKRCSQLVRPSLTPARTMGKATTASGTPGLMQTMPTQPPDLGGEWAVRPEGPNWFRERFGVQSRMNPYWPPHSLGHILDAHHHSRRDERGSTSLLHPMPSIHQYPAHRRTS